MSRPMSRAEIESSTRGRNYSGVFFVGLGDQFDDDRRLVREASSAPRPAIRLIVGWRFLSSHFRRQDRPPVGSNKAKLLRSGHDSRSTYGPNPSVMVPRIGFEPTTPALRMRCSTG